MSVISDHIAEWKIGSLWAIELTKNVRCSTTRMRQTYEARHVFIYVIWPLYHFYCHHANIKFFLGSSVVCACLLWPVSFIVISFLTFSKFLNTLLPWSNVMIENLIQQWNIASTKVDTAARMCRRNGKSLWYDQFQKSRHLPDPTTIDPSRWSLSSQDWWKG